MAKKKAARVRTPPAAPVEGPAPPPSLGDAVAALRTRIEASPPPAEGDTTREAVIGVLSRLEADYARLVAGRGGKRAVLSFERVLEASGGIRPDDEGDALSPQAMFVPTPHEMVEAMLRMAAVTSQDIVYDLGCGDGRIVIAAAKEFGARAIGIDKDPVRIAEANANAEHEGVTRRVKFIEGDLFDADIRKATVVMLYLLPSLNVQLRGKLVEQLEQGVRVVSHAFDMGDWEPSQKLEVGGRTAFLWIVPERGELS